MKVPISDNAVIDLDAPVLSAYRVQIKGTVRWFVWCKHCQVWYKHGSGEGHRQAHRNDSVKAVLANGAQLGLCWGVETCSLGSRGLTHVAMVGPFSGNQPCRDLLRVFGEACHTEPVLQEHLCVWLDAQCLNTQGNAVSSAADAAG